MKRYHMFIIVPLVLLAFVLLFRVQSAVSAPSGIGNGLTFSQQGVKTEIPTGQIILKFKDTNGSLRAVIPSQAELVQRLNDAAGTTLTYSREMSGGASVYKLPEKIAVEEVRNIANKLMALPEVDYAEPDLIMQIMTIPNDPLYGSQWHYFPPTAGNYGIDMPAAWDITQGASNVVVAVIDTGITDHADLAGRTVPGYDFITDIPTANDGDGRDADPHDPGDWTTTNQCYSGWIAENSSWHGTHTAGTIGAASNNGVGVAGINWNSKILPVRVLGCCGGYTSDIVDGMRWAAGLPVYGVPLNANPAKVISLSLGGYAPTGCSSTYQTAINAITAAGATVVVAAGNNNDEVSLYQPANCNGVISVAATDRNGNMAYYSNHGSSVKISAPGGAQSGPNDPNGVLSTLNTGTTTPISDTYVYYQGTSMATPHVSGVASLLYSLDPSITPAQVLQIMQNTVTAFPVSSTCTTSICGPGILNAGTAVSVLPRLTKMNLSYVDQGSGPLTLIVTGTNFINGSTINWDGSIRTTAYVSTTVLTTTLAASDFSASGMHRISVTVPIYSNLTTSSLTLKVGNNFIFMPMVFKPAPPPANWTNILTENFEGTFPGVWQLYPAGAAYSWGKRTCNPYEGSNSAWAVGGGTSGTKLSCTAKYPVNQQPWMIYGPFNLLDAQAADLRFKYSINTVGPNDKLCWFASLDDNNYWGWCVWGNSSGWVDGVLDLNNVYTLGSVLGQSPVWVSFVFYSDSANTLTGGAYVDNVTLRKCTSIYGCVGSLILQPTAINNLKGEGAIKSPVR